MTTHGKPSSTGDEPHYLMVSHSLLVDGDLDVANNYAQNDGRFIGHDGLTAGPHARETRAGRTWSTHDIGLPVLLVPAVAIGEALAASMSDEWLARMHQSRGRFAYGIVSAFVIGLTAFGSWLLAAGLSTLASERRAAIVSLAVVLSPPVVAHGFLVFPEGPAFVIVCAVVWLACRPTGGMTLPVALPVVLALGVLPWLHRKYSLLALALLFVLWRRHRSWWAEGPSRALALVGVAVVPQILLHTVTWLAWGHVGGPHLLDYAPFTLSGMPTGAFGLLFDRSRGLFAYAPLYLVAPFAWWIAGRGQRDLMAPILCLFLPMAAFTVWGAGYSPAARHLVPLMPLVAIPVAPALDRRWFARAGTVLLALQLLINGYAWRQPRVLWPGAVGENPALDALPVIGPFYARLLPVLDDGQWLR
jgi:hypothetical protein